MEQRTAEICRSRVIDRDRIEQAGAKALAGGDVVVLSHLFKAMGDPSRMKILWTLAQGEMCVCDLAAFLGVTESAVSHHLRLLRQLHLVANRREGVVLYYRLEGHRVSELLSAALKQVRE